MKDIDELIEALYTGTFRTTQQDGDLKVWGRYVRKTSGYVLQTMIIRDNQPKRVAVFITTEYEDPDTNLTFTNANWHELPVYSIGFSVQENIASCGWDSPEATLADIWNEEVGGFNDWLDMEFD